ncbi:TPA: 5'/3'-nucleotidase SurE [Candidatus Micrarchaeota archaeon]|nr:5'/3'-nucleotidase SurE [Candidatus Micrarchaeota archaeon]
MGVRMNILVTNDDGYSEGFKVLMEVARKLGDAYAVIPAKQMSAVSGALTLHKPLRLHKRERDVYEINGTPADCVLFSCYSKEFEKPDLILSGINWGDNAGMGPLLGSGTLGACWQGILEGVPGIGFSRFTTHRDWRNKEAWGDLKKMKKLVLDVSKKLSGKDMEDETFYSVNLPDDLTSPKIVITKNLQKRRFMTQITKKFDPGGSPYFWVSGKPRGFEKGTDLHEIAVNKNITVTKISLEYFEV